MIGERFPDPSRDPRDQIKEIVKENGWRFLLTGVTVAVEKLTSVFENRSFKTYYFIMIDDKLMGDSQLREEWVLFSKRVEKNGVVFVHPYEDNGDFGEQILSEKSWHIEDKEKIEDNIASIMILEDKYNEFDPKENRHFLIKMDDYMSDTGSTLVLELNKLFVFLENTIRNRKDLIKSLDSFDRRNEFQQAIGIVDKTQHGPFIIYWRKVFVFLRNLFNC